MLKFICITVFVQKLEIFLTSLRVFENFDQVHLHENNTDSRLEEGTINNGKEYIFETYIPETFSKLTAS